MSKHRWEKDGKHVQWCLDCGLHQQSATAGRTWYRYWREAGATDRTCSDEGARLPECLPNEHTKAAIAEYRSRRDAEIAEWEAKAAHSTARHRVFYREPTDLSNLADCVARMDQARESYLAAARRCWHVTNSQVARFEESDRRLIQEVKDRAAYYGVTS